MIVSFLGVISRFTKPYFLLSAEEKDFEAGLQSPSLLMDHHEDSNLELPIHKEFGTVHMKRFFSKEINVDQVYLLMLVCCLITGFVDGTLYNAFSTFVSMQTGNTIFVALGVSGQNSRPYGWARSLTSICCFILGSFWLSRLSRKFGPRRRGTLVLSFFIQSVCILVAAGLIEGGVIGGPVPFNPLELIHWTQLIPIALLSFQSAGQIVTSRALDVSEIPTVVITSLLCDLFSDPDLFIWPPTTNRKRNNRAMAFTLTLVGAIVGGWVSKVTHKVGAMLWVAGGTKMFITLSWMVWATV